MPTFPTEEASQCKDNPLTTRLEAPLHRPRPSPDSLSPLTPKLLGSAITRPPRAACPRPQGCTGIFLDTPGL